MAGGAIISFIFEIFQALIEATAGIPWLSNLITWAGGLFAIGSLVLLVVCIVRSALGMDEDKRSASNTRK